LEASTIAVMFTEQASNLEWHGHFFWIFEFKQLEWHGVFFNFSDEVEQVNS